MLTNADPGTLAVHQIAAHLQTRPWNVTRELQLGAAGQPGRLHGDKVFGQAGTVGRGGQWRVDRDTYLTWLGIPAEDRDHLGPDGLPELHLDTEVAARLEMDPYLLRALIRQYRLPHLCFGRARYLTHHQLARLRALVAPDYREHTQ